MGDDAAESNSGSANGNQQELPSLERWLTLLTEGTALNVPEIDAEAIKSAVSSIRSTGTIQLGEVRSIAFDKVDGYSTPPF
jgi:hypothetical protein